MSTRPFRVSATQKPIVEEWAKAMAQLAEGPDAGWSIYYAWLNAFLSAVHRAAPVGPEGAHNG